MSKTGQSPPAAEAEKRGGTALPSFPGVDPADLERFFEANRSMIQNILDINRAMFDFMDTRFKSDAAVFDELCKYKDWQKASKVQTRFMSNLTQQYFDQTTKMMETATKLLSTQRLIEHD
ncbi:MAG: phasin family protein [Rhodospirillales bacterium]|nr:phasin family protein [Rhodospirillales bacterium]